MWTTNLHFAFKIQLYRAVKTVDTWLTERCVDRMKNDDWLKDFFYQKWYVLYGSIGMFRACLQKALLTKSCQLFTFLFIHTKCTFSIAMRLFCRELAGKSSPSCARFYYFTDFGSLRFTMCHVVRLKRWFFHLVNAILAVWILKIFKHIYPLETSMQITTYLWLWRIWF